MRVSVLQMCCVLSSMSYVLYLIKHILDLPITIFLNLYLFPLATAVRLPILFHWRTRIGDLHRGNIEIAGDVRPFMIKYGVEGVAGVASERRSTLHLSRNARVIFRGKANLARGVSIRCEGGTIDIGKNIYANCNLSLICISSISIGEGTLLGWDVSIRDCDGHCVYVDDVENPSEKPVEIGSNVWIGAHVDILKGVQIKNGSVVAYRSCVLKPFEEEHILIGGYPARVLKHRVSWKA